MKQQYVTPQWRIHKLGMEDVVTLSGDENKNDNVKSYEFWTTEIWTD